MKNVRPLVGVSACLPGHQVRYNGDHKRSRIVTDLLSEHMPLLPLIEEGRLTDPDQRDHFIVQVFAYAQLVELSKRLTLKSFQKFHEHYKLLLMSHSPKHYQALGRKVALTKRETLSSAYQSYFKEFMDALKVPPTRGKRANALEHALGYFKPHLESKDRQRIQTMISKYRNGKVAFAVPLELLNFLIEKYGVAYLKDQEFFQQVERILPAQE